jgi:hypothetical protein
VSFARTYKPGWTGAKIAGDAGVLTHLGIYLIAPFDHASKAYLEAKP